MKILKIFGLVVGIHVFALILIFANPGCSSTSKPIPAPVDTVAASDSSATVNLPMTAPDGSSPMTSAPINFNPDAPATASSGGGSGGVRFTPTRPGTAAASTLLSTPVADVTPATTYTVKGGDTLWDLGKKFHVPYAEIAAANNLKTSVPLHAGQKLIIPGKPAPVAASGGVSPASTPALATAKPIDPAKTATVSPAGATKDVVKHTVKPNETLSTIARTYGVKQGDIAVANNISDPQKIRAGMELIIPGWQATAAKSSAKPGSDGASKPAAAKPADSKPVFNIIDPGTGTVPPAAGTEAPVIKVEDNPMTPAPKG